MINSQKQSSNRTQREILKDFLEGLITLSQLQALLKGCITINFDLAPWVRKIQDIHIDQSIKIPVKKENLCEMLRKYISKEISEKDLSNWAAFVFTAPFYVPEGETEEERFQAGEGPIWEIIQKLVVPDICDGLNIDAARQYLSLLSCNKKM